MLCLHLMQPTNRFSPLDVALKKVLLWRSILRLDLLHVIQLLKSTFEFEDDQIYSNSLERWSSIFLQLFTKAATNLVNLLFFALKLDLSIGKVQLLIQTKVLKIMKI